jgi:hypothetical protein
MRHSMADSNYVALGVISLSIVWRSLLVFLSLLHAIVVLITSSAWRALKWTAAIFAFFVLSLIATVVALTLVFPTNRDEAYRRVDPEASICDLATQMVRRNHGLCWQK